jgi:phosphoribosylamine---glycine ligase
MRDGRLVTNGGRILSVTALAPELEQARRQAYDAVERVRFEGVRFRRDIAAVARG